MGTEHQIAATLGSLLAREGKQLEGDTFIVGTVVPSVEEALTRFAEVYLGVSPMSLTSGEEVGLPVDFSPPHGVGADRIANALGALAKEQPPFIVVDFGTATTFDTVDHTGTYVGGAIYPGVLVSLEGLVARAAKLPSFALEAPEKAIGKTTVQSLQSGLMTGYAAAVDGIVRRISQELTGSVTVLSTGGLGSVFQDLCETIDYHDPDLTLDGLRIAASRIVNNRRSP
jgi:type III pantothenate kinase